MFTILLIIHRQIVRLIIFVSALLQLVAIKLVPLVILYRVIGVNKYKSSTNHFFYQISGTQLSFSLTVAQLNVLLISELSLQLDRIKQLVGCSNNSVGIYNWAHRSYSTPQH